MHGLLLINLGTPDAPTTAAVRRYLREFLADPRVLDINPVLRTLLLELVILPFRSPKSAEAYRTIWDPSRGSPLLYHTQDLAAGVQSALGTRWRVVVGMRYGRPSIQAALGELLSAGCTEISVLPLYPQYAASSTGTSCQEVMARAATLWNVPPLRLLPAFYDQPPFLDAFASVSTEPLRTFAPDHVLFSFHGLPERHVDKSHRDRSTCATAGCRERVPPEGQACYLAHCFATARGLATRLGLSADRYTVCFQSRLGRTPWLKPYTDVVIDQLAAQGRKRLAVLCPAFVADCLETLEEIGGRAKEQFQAAGGQDLLLVPSLNGSAAWVDAVVQLVTAPVQGAPLGPS